MRKKREVIDERKNVRTPPPAPTASTIGPYPTIIKISRMPRQWKFTQNLRTTRPPRLTVSFTTLSNYSSGNTWKSDQENNRQVLQVNLIQVPGSVAQSVGHLTRKSGVLGSIPGLATYFRFSFRFVKKGSCQLLAKVCARSTG